MNIHDKTIPVQKLVSVTRGLLNNIREYKLNYGLIEFFCLFLRRDQKPNQFLPDNPNIFSIADHSIIPERS